VITEQHLTLRNQEVPGCYRRLLRPDSPGMDGAMLLSPKGQMGPCKSKVGLEAAGSRHFKKAKFGGRF